MRSGEMILHRALSWDDIQRLKGFNSIYETNQGKLLARSNGRFILLEPSSNGKIPEKAIFAAPYAIPVSLSRGLSLKRMLKTILARYRNMMLGDFAGLFSTFGVRKELSVELSEFIWPQKRDAIQVQFRSSEAGLPSPSQLKAVFGNTEGDSSAEFCLAACIDGTVRWLREFECNEEGHIWTMHLFDPHFRGPIRFSQRLRRTRPISSCNICGNHIGNNVNHNGIQIIGDVSSSMQR